MANNFFQFKDFIVYQDKCGMKVCTDACILGAWVAGAVFSEQLKINKCLDIGTGTGLLSLMLTQKTTAFVDAIEIDDSAFNQAVDNFRSCNWGERLQAFHADAKYFCPGKQYDLIICNPPFYEDNLLSPEKNKNVAMHDAGLKLDDLIVIIKKNLCSEGNFALLLPYNRIDYFENIAKENNFFLRQKLLIKSTPAHNYFRAILLFGYTKSTEVVKELTIKSDGHYSDGFVALLKDYYLHL